MNRWVPCRTKAHTEERQIHLLYIFPSTHFTVKITFLTYVHKIKHRLSVL